MKRKLTVILGLILFLSSAHAPSEENWIFLTEGGVKAYYQTGTCDSRNVMFLKFENTQGANVKVDFLMLLEGNPPTPHVIELQSNQIITGQCMGTPDLLKEWTNASATPHLTLRIIP
jgi:hypothetical protein